MKGPYEGKWLWVGGYVNCELRRGRMFIRFAVVELCFSSVQNSALVACANAVANLQASAASGMTGKRNRLLSVGPKGKHSGRRRR